MTPRDGRHLVPPAAHRPVVVLASVCAVLLVALAIGFHGGHGYTGLDEWIVQSLPYPESHQHLLTRLADVVPPVFVLLVVVLVVVGAVRRDAPLAALAAVGPGLSMLVTEAGKHVVRRTLEGQLALPSGHTTGVTSVSLVVAFVLVRATNRQTRAACTAALGAVTLAALAMGAVMVLLRFHYPTDIAAGWAAAVACTLGSALVIDRVAGDRRSRELATG